METPVDQIAALVEARRASYKKGILRSAKARKNALNMLYKLLDERESEFCAALNKDMGRPRCEALSMEVDFAKTEVAHTVSQLEKWMKGDGPTHLSLPFLFDRLRVERQPLGVVLIIAPWNYPVLLTLGPIIGAIAAGNTVVLKPSELAPNVAELLTDTLPKYLGEELISLVNGAIPQTTELLKQRFDHIFYTGGPMVAKIVMRAAAEHLTPVTLELGGKSPVVVSRSCDPAMVARRLVWGRCLNAGQTCVAPDYVLCEKGIEHQLVEGMKKAIQEFFGPDPKQSASYSRIINERHFKRIEKLLEDSKCDPVISGERDISEKYFPFTAVLNPPKNSPLMTEEIFGPILPISVVNTIEEAIEHINAGEKPLALYIFSSDNKVSDKVRLETSSGSVCVNDCIMQLATHALPFGGVGNSGMGRYHGKYSFDAFSHQRAVLEKKASLEKLVMERVNVIRYPPYRDWKISVLQMILSKGMPSSSRVKIGWLLLAVVAVAAILVGIALAV